MFILFQTVPMYISTLPL